MAAMMAAGDAAAGVRTGFSKVLPPMRTFLVVALLCALSACASSYRGIGPTPNSSQLKAYAPPGPTGDPWGPYIEAASRRFDVPERWIREVMRQESGGRQYLNGTLITSPAGAMGLMQVMPQTYAELRQRYGLGADPYDPHDNIFAGTAYIGELYRRYGSPGFLAAYNAGPQRLEDYLAGDSRLPAETRAYVAAVAPRLGGAAAPTGPLARYVGPARGPSADELNRQSLAAADAPLPASGNDALNNAALAAARSPAPPAVARVTAASDTRVVAAVANRSAARPGDDVLADDEPPPRVTASPEPARLLPAVAVTPSNGAWGVQVGAFSNPSLASTAVRMARTRAGGPLDGARAAIGTVARPDGSVLYRARLVGISPDSAQAACEALAAARVACAVLSPARL